MDKSGLMTFYVAAQFIAEKLVDSNMWSDMRQNKSQQDFFFTSREVTDLWEEIFSIFQFPHSFKPEGLLYLYSM